MSNSLPQIGKLYKFPAGLGYVTRVVPEKDMDNTIIGHRVYFKYIRKGKPSQTERNVFMS